MRITNGLTRAAFSLNGVAAALALAFAGGAGAMEIDTGNPDVKMRWDNTVRYNLGVRVEDQDKRLMRSPTYDEGDSKFDQGEIVTNRLDLMSEFDVSYKNQYGLRLTGTAWYDNAYDDHSVKTPAGFASSYDGSKYNSTVKRYVNGPSGELLDAFVWTNLDIGKVPVNVKVGRHTNVWGEGVLLGAHAISYSQSPVDGVKAVTSPGIEVKEVFLPIGQVSAKAQVTESVTLMGQYFYDWEPTRVPHGGTYLMGADTSPEVDRLTIPAPVPAAGIADPRTPKKNGNWGVGARWNLEAIESTLGAYYRKFDDYTPELGVQALAFRGPLPTSARFLYPEDVELYGVSFARVIGGVSVGAELSYRKNGALNTTSLHTLETGARGNTWHAIVNGIYLLPKTALWDTGSLVAELAYNRLDKITENEQLYRGVGYASCRDLVRGGAAPAASGGRSDGCSTRDFTQIAINFKPQYLNILPSWDLELPMSVNYGLSGNAPSSGGGFEGELSWAIGATMIYASKYEFSLRYADRDARTKYNAADVAVGGQANNSSIGATDRGWLAFTFKTAF